MWKKKNKKQLSLGSFSSHELSIASQLIDPDDLTTTFEDIGGLEDIKIRLFEETVLPLQRPDLFCKDGILSAPKGILLYGPPGTGKTLLAKAIAKETKATFIEVKLSSILSKWFGETIHLTQAVFSLAEKLAPTILFIDEIDSIFRERNSFDHETNHQMKCSFMSLWDGLQSNEKCTVVVVGATNRPWDVDEGIRRRMPRQFFVDSPGEQQRKEILTIMLKKQNVDFTDLIDELARMTEGFTGSDLRELCRDACQIPIRDYYHQTKNSTPDLSTSTAHEIGQPTLEHFKKAMKYITPVYSDRRAFHDYARKHTARK